MPKKKDLDLEEIFLREIEKNHLLYTGKIFNMGNSALLADYMFGNTLVIFMDDVQQDKIDNIIEFKRCFVRFEVVLVTNNWDAFVDYKCFSEIYDGKDLPKLVKKLLDNR